MFFKSEKQYLFTLELIKTRDAELIKLQRDAAIRRNYEQRKTSWARKRIFIPTPILKNALQSAGNGDTEQSPEGGRHQS